MKWTTVILAAGKGTRMKSPRAKVLHRVAGRCLIDHVLDQAEKLVPSDRIIVVIGHQAEQVREHLRRRNPAIRTVVQEPQLGTGDALRTAMDDMELREDTDCVLVLSGDVPLLRPSTLEKLRELVDSGVEAALLTARVDQPGSYGRVLRDSSGLVEKIVEARDASPEVLEIQEINAGIYAFRTTSLRPALAGLRTENAQEEYYLTDVIGYLTGRGFSIGAFCVSDPEEISGVNTGDDLRAVEETLRRRKSTHPEVGT